MKYGIGVVSLLLICGFSSAAPTKASKPVVFVEKVQEAKIFDKLTYPARIVPKINATLLSESEGVVDKIYVPLGRNVKKGSPVIRVRHTDPVYEYAPMIVRAPVTGVVSGIEITEGSRVRKGDKLASITNPYKIRINIEIAANDLSSVKSGLSGKLQLPGSDDLVAVKVLGVSPFVDPATGTASGELVVTDPRDHIVLHPGRVGKVHFQINAHSGIQLIEDAVVFRNKKTYVRSVTKGKAKLIEIKLGPTRRGSVEVTSGVKNGDIIVIRSNQFIADGEDVQIAKDSKRKAKKKVN